MSAVEEIPKVMPVRTLKREPTIPELILPDLKKMEALGAYDRNVLLWLQDRYAIQAVRENIGELREINNAIRAEGMSDEDAQRQRIIAISKFTRETYSTEKAAGRGADLQSYIEAAKTFFEAESARYGNHLKEVAEYIRQSLASGVKPDIERYAREAYLSMSKIQEASHKLERMVSRPAALQVVAFMREGIEEINFAAVSSTDQVNVGRQMLLLVKEISAAPQKYIEFQDPSTMKMPERSPWDMEPMHRQGVAEAAY